VFATEISFCWDQDGLISQAHGCRMTHLKYFRQTAQYNCDFD
jgi:hypothetical protein